MELFLVGGAVRDEIMGIDSKDWDFSVVAPSFEEVERELRAGGFEIFLSTPEFFTIRARGPKGFTFGGREFGTQTFDFVWARKDGTYSDGRRPDFVLPGTLHDDLSRRDFSVNAIAKDRHGNLIDPFNGRADIDARLIRAVGNARDRIIGEDALRGLRALRFSVTKGFGIDNEVTAVLKSQEFRQALRSVSTERIREELDKMFKVDTFKSLLLIQELRLEGTLFNDTGLRLMPTMKA